MKANSCLVPVAILAAVTLVIPYSFQVVLVLANRVFPVAHQVEDGQAYTLKRGRGNLDDFIPFLGLPFPFDPAYLDIKNLETDERQRIRYDFVSQALSEHKEVLRKEFLHRKGITE